MESKENPRASAGNLPRPADVANADRVWHPALSDDISSEDVLEIATEVVERSLQEIDELKPTLHFLLDTLGLVCALVLFAVSNAYAIGCSITSLASLGIVFGAFVAGIFTTRLITSRRFWLWRVQRGRQLALKEYAESVIDFISARGDETRMTQLSSKQIAQLRSFAKFGRLEPKEGLGL